MPTDPRIEQLLEEIVATGKSPDEVCRGCSELLPIVLERLRHVRAVEAEVAAMFPGSGTKATGAGAFKAFSGAALPDVPGYTVLNVLGRGGMGVVYMARHLKLDRIVAIKMLLAGGFASAAELARFLREARAIAGLRHPHIVQVHDIGDLDGRPYFTMEYVEGGSLAQKLAGAPQPAQHAAATVATLARAVSAAHTSGIVHRDLKPANIMLTSDGTPKIADFGLARRYDEGPDLTLGGTRMGTPSYMSPEQAVGKQGTVGPSADIYSLGAVLYEMLTGRPPFRGDSPAETERQLLADDPAPPRLLNGRVPRDLEVICLKCLHKSPASRYASAQALADDLDNFQAGRPIAARPVGVAERTAKWIRRSPARATLIAGGVIAAFAASGAALWFLSARASQIAAVQQDLSAAIQYEHQADWREAGSALDRATIRLGDTGESELRARLGAAKAELALVGRLDGIRLLRAGSAGGVLNNARASTEYANAFVGAGIGGAGDEPATVAKRIGATAISSALVAALYDWALATQDAVQRGWIERVVGLADRDADPQGWRRSARDSASWTTKASIVRLADEVPVDEQPITFLFAFSEALHGAGVDAVPFVARAQSAHPDDFWLTTAMGNALKHRGRHADSVGYYRAAVALRPDAMASYYNLGRALGEIGQFDEAIDCFRTALKRDPGALDPLKSLGLSLAKAGRHEEALREFLAAAHRDAEDSFLQLQMSWSYANLGRYQEAAESYERSLDLKPEQWQDRPGTRALLLKRGCHDLASALWKKQLALRTTDLNDWDGYAELCLFRGDAAEYERVRGVLLDRFGTSSEPNPCERLGRACVLLPPSSPEQLAQANALIDRALASEAIKRTWAYPYFRFARALADYRAGDFSSAAAIVEGESANILGPAPKLVAAMCRARRGEGDMARKILAEACIGYDWTISRAENREAWIYHVLRREAERLAMPELDRWVQGQSDPSDDDSRLALLGACQSEERFGRGARLWSAVLASQGSTPERFAEPAARTFILAGLGAGADASQYTPTDRLAWREQGLSILMLRLGELESRIRSGDTGAEAIRGVVRAWQTAPEYHAVREGSLLASLLNTEQSRWKAFWQRTEAVAGSSVSVRP